MFFYYRKIMREQAVSNRPEIKNEACRPHFDLLILLAALPYYRASMVSLIDESMRSRLLRG